MTTSLQIFRGFFSKDEHGCLDVKGITSNACFEVWMEMRSKPATTKQFLRTLLSHVSAIDGRSPFSEEEEQAVIKLLRHPDTTWECFPNGDLPVKLRIRGFHEKIEKARIVVRSIIFTTAVATVYNFVQWYDSGFLAKTCARYPREEKSRAFLWRGVKG